jgi:hypothetical protein
MVWFLNPEEQLMACCIITFTRTVIVIVVITLNVIYLTVETAITRQRFGY